MLKSPHKKSSIKFLRYLRDNRFISPGGKEYSEPEVLEMLIDKESRLGLVSLKKAAPYLDPFHLMREHQEAIFSLLKTWKA